MSIRNTVGSRSYQSYEAAALNNLNKMSRTRHGESNTSSSPDKPKLTAEGKKLAELATSNFFNSLEFAWENRHRELAASDDAQEVVLGIATRISNGLLQPGQSLYRTWELDYCDVTPHEIPDEMTQFYDEFAESVDTQPPIRFTAWSEKEIHSRIHPFSDGCGRSSQTLSAFILMRHDLALPSYRDRGEYYASIEKPHEEWAGFYQTYFNND